MTSRLWERITGESEIEHGIFRLYLMTPAPRLPPHRWAPTMNVQPDRARELARVHFWAQRADSFDRFYHCIDDPHYKAIADETDESVNTKHKELLAMARELTALELSKMLALSRKQPYAVAKPTQLTQLMRTVVQLDRLVRDQHAGDLEPVDADADDDFGRGLSDEDLAEYDRIVHKGQSKGDIK